MVVFSIDNLANKIDTILMFRKQIPIHLVDLVWRIVAIFGALSLYLLESPARLVQFPT